MKKHPVGTVDSGAMERIRLALASLAASDDPKPLLSAYLSVQPILPTDLPRGGPREALEQLLSLFDQEEHRRRQRGIATTGDLFRGIEAAHETEIRKAFTNLFSESYYHNFLSVASEPT